MSRIYEEPEVDELLRGKKYAVTISVPLNLMDAIRNWQGRKFIRGNNSHVYCRLLRLGLTYQEVLDFQEQERLQKATETIETKPKKKRKPKTPSK